jgi:hypothetical protein
MTTSGDGMRTPKHSTLLRRHDLEELRQKLSNLRPPNKTLNTLGCLCWGAATSAVLTLFTLSSKSPTWTACWVVTVTTAVAGTVFLFLDNSRNDNTASREDLIKIVNRLIDECDALEQTLHAFKGKWQMSSLTKESGKMAKGIVTFYSNDGSLGFFGELKGETDHIFARVVSERCFFDHAAGELLVVYRTEMVGQPKPSISKCFGVANVDGDGRMTGLWVQLFGPKTPASGRVDFERVS